MPMMLEGSCRCGAAHFRVESHTPQPYQRCYCSICRKTAGGGGYAINLAAVARTLTIDDPYKTIAVYNASIRQPDGLCELSDGERNFCSRCATALWMFSPQWPELLHPFASAIDNALPAPVATTHLMLKFKPSWVVAQIGPDDLTFDLYPRESIEDWHRRHGVWVD